MTPKDTRRLATDLRSVINRLTKKLRKTTSSTVDKLSLTERSIIGLLDQHKELTPGELAVMEKITAQSMSQIVSHLLELGYITRSGSVTDKRKVIIALSPEGQALLQRVRSERDEWLYKALNEVCTPEERLLLQQVVGPLARLVDFE